MFPIDYVHTGCNDIYIRRCNLEIPSVQAIKKHIRESDWHNHILRQLAIVVLVNMLESERDP